MASASGCPKAYSGMGDAAGAAVGTAVLGPGIGTAVGSILNIGSIFGSSAAGPNTDAAKAVLPLALAGNLAAVAAIITRNGIQTQTSLAPWKAALAALPQSLIDAANQHFPGNNWTTFGAIDPTQVVPTVKRLAVYAQVNSSGNVVGTGVSSTPSVLPTTGSNVLAAGVGSSPLMILLIAGLGVGLLLKKKGRR